MQAGATSMDEPTTSDKLRLISEGMDYLHQENYEEKLSLNEILDIDLIFNQMEGKGYWSE